MVTRFHAFALGLGLFVLGACSSTSVNESSSDSGTKGGTSSGGASGGTLSGGGSAGIPSGGGSAGATSCGATGGMGGTGAVIGGCVTPSPMPPSCAGLPATCGLNKDENCCSSCNVTGGQFNRSNDPTYPATINNFRLDRYEITVGRFRKFVSQQNGWVPPKGSGKHLPDCADGWQESWTIPTNLSDWELQLKCWPSNEMWTSAEGANEDRPLNCLTWLAAYAFCIWDGGFLPTEAEWNYAAAGGSEQRKYPWADQTVSPDYASYNVDGGSGCMGDNVYGCSNADILWVGSKPMGEGKYGQRDLGGNLFEWTLDLYATPYSTKTCDNCVHLTDKPAVVERVMRGGSFSYDAGSMLNANRDHHPPDNAFDNLGARCARTLP